MTTTPVDSGPLRPPAPRPCESCPYRRDVPSGIWAQEEYEKLRRYDAETQDQPTGVFQCHQNHHNAAGRRICAGWVGSHDAPQLIALRIALAAESIDAATYRQAVEYISPVPLFGSGAEAADHGQAEIHHPAPEARHLMGKISRVRGDVLR